MRRGAFTLAEASVAVAVGGVLLVLFLAVMTWGWRACGRSQDALSVCQALLAIDHALRADASAIDCGDGPEPDPAGAVRFADGALALAVRTGATTAPVEYRFDARARTLVRRAAGRTQKIVAGPLVELDVTVHAGAEHLEIEVTGALVGADSGRTEARVPFRLRYTPVRLNRRLQSRWITPRPRTGNT